jgi:hypothetical protein
VAARPPQPDLQRIVGDTILFRSVQSLLNADIGFIRKRDDTKQQ